jgi:hypothetical protein
LACNHYHVLFVELDPVDRPDLAGVARQVARPFEWEQPYQKLEIAVGGFIVATAGWLAECKAADACRWYDEALAYNCDFGDDGKPDWGEFEAHDDGEDCDFRMAGDYISKAASALDSRVTPALIGELREAAWWTVCACWASIEDLARELDRSGRVEALSNYWPDGCIGKVPEVCAKLAMRHRRCHPKVREYVRIWRREV